MDLCILFWDPAKVMPLEHLNGLQSPHSSIWAVLYSAPPIPAGIRSFQRNSGGIHRNSGGILQESSHSSGIPVESTGIHRNSAGIPLE